ncbi:hypothetical protein ACGFR6_15830 [Streptomyces sp. NPDC048567]|uniref:hypothetical protein n=1 Tax=Streptomyces sp. NPDC048567 TaxID=3365570 RepID=UPI003719AF28
MPFQEFAGQPAPLPGVLRVEWAEGIDFALPFFVFQGAHDVLTPPGPARAFYEGITAPAKDFALIEDAGHFASFRHPDRFLELMLTRVRPTVAA